MNPKATATLEKAREDRRRANFKKALSRLEEAIGKFPKELPLCTEAIDVGMEAGESLKAIQIIKKSQRVFPEDAFELWTFTAEKVGVYNDPIVGRFMLEQATRSKDLTAAYAILQSLSDRSADDVLDHIRTKKQTMSLALGTKLAAREDVESYTLGEALLQLRLGRTAEAVEGFVRALDENPGLFKPLEPFLTDVDKQHGDNGEASYALGCCHIAGGRPSKGIEALVRAARRSPTIAPKVIEKIESIGDHPDLPVDVRHLNLAELHLGQNNPGRACELLSAMLERNPGIASKIADMLRPAVEDVGENLGVHFIFVEASFIAGKRDSALSQLRKIQRCREHKASLVEWLETKSRSERISVEVQLFFAETALSEGLHGKAIEIIKEILSHGPQEEGTIRELLSKYQSIPLIQHFYNERFGASQVGVKATTGEFERFEDSGFGPVTTGGSLRDAAAEKQPPPGDARGAGAERMDIDTPSPGTAVPLASDGPEVPRSDFDNRDFSLRMNAPEEPVTGEAMWDEPAPASFPDEGDAPSPSEEDESDLFEYLKRDFAPEDVPPAGDEERVGPAVEETFDGTAGPPGREPEGTFGETAHDDDEDQAAALPEDFDSLYRAFLAGTLDRGRTIEVVEKAFDEDRMDEMKTLLAFEPANLGEEIARKHQLARYYLATDRPMSALVALKSVQLGALSKQERKTFMLRIAECYRQLHNYEAAHGVYLRVLSDHPGDCEAEAAARDNYAMYIEAAAGAAPMLEKLTNL